MLKRIFIAAALIAIIITAALFVYRHTIVRYFAEKLIRSNLPPYIKFEKINFNFADGRVNLDNIEVLNPPGFSSKNVIKISSVSFKYGVMGIGIPRGLEISEVMVKGADIFVERVREGGINNEGAVNLVEMRNFALPQQPAGIPAPQEKGAVQPQPEARAPRSIMGAKPSEIIKLPPSFRIKNGKVEFWDRVPYDKPHVITIESIDGEIFMGLDDNYSRVTGLSFTLAGDLNGVEGAKIKWISSLDPETPKLTMSNRFEVKNLDIRAFEPYYDKYSPFVFKRGRFSGTLVFDFNNGDIGSTNVIKLSDILFWVKPGYENAEMWETNVQELLRYFTTASGDVVFDFKIKGSMSKPAFQLGPISRRAMTAMAVNKISSYAIQAMTNPNDAAAKGVDKAKGYIDLIKGMIKK